LLIMVILIDIIGNKEKKDIIFGHVNL
jgi:hypothetical protein